MMSNNLLIMSLWLLLFMVIYTFHDVHSTTTGTTVTATTCKIDPKSFPGIVFRPRPVKRITSFAAKSIVIMECARDGNTATIVCKDDGTWTREPPPCGVDEDEGCPYHPEFDRKRWPSQHMLFMNITVPTVPTPAAAAPFNGNSNDILSSAPLKKSKQTSSSAAAGLMARDMTTSFGPSSKLPLKTVVYFACEDGFKLVGPSRIVCGTKFNWSFKVPICEEVIDLNKQVVSTNYKLTIIWLSITILTIAVGIVSSLLVCKWRQRMRQQKQWKRYFGDYTYRQSKTRITRPSTSTAPNSGLAKGGNNRKSMAAGPSTAAGTGSTSTTAAAAGNRNNELQLKSGCENNEDTETIYSTATITSVSTTMTSITNHCPLSSPLSMAQSSPSLPLETIKLTTTTISPTTTSSPSPLKFGHHDIDLNDLVPVPAPPSAPFKDGAHGNDPVYANININNVNNSSSLIVAATSTGLSDVEDDGQDMERFKKQRRSPIVPVTDL